jgi:hypothetical protein
VRFHSPYEAAAWAVIAGHRAQRQAAGIRRHLAETIGEGFDLAGERLHAFPTPRRLLDVDKARGLAPEQFRSLQEGGGLTEATPLHTDYAASDASRSSSTSASDAASASGRSTVAPIRMAARTNPTLIANAR